MRSLELGGARVLNGSRAFALELSKSAQAALMHRLGSRTRAPWHSTTSTRRSSNGATAGPPC